MNDISLRVWSKEDKQMYEVYQLEINTGNFLGFDRWQANGELNETNSVLNIGTGVTVGEDEIEIFEGDVIRDRETGVMYIVVYTPAALYLYTAGETIDFPKRLLFNTIVTKLDQIEILGNVSANPELRRSVYLQQP